HPQHLFRIFQHVFSVYDGCDGIRASSDEIENLCLLQEAEALDRRNLSFFDIRTNYCARIANQETVCHCAKPSALYLWQKIVRHLLLPTDPLAMRTWPGERRGY